MDILTIFRKYFNQNEKCPVDELKEKGIEVVEQVIHFSPAFPDFWNEIDDERDVISSLSRKPIIVFYQPWFKDGKLMSMSYEIFDETLWLRTVVLYTLSEERRQKNLRVDTSMGHGAILYMYEGQLYTYTYFTDTNGEAHELNYLIVTTRNPFSTSDYEDYILPYKNGEVYEIPKKDFVVTHGSLCGLAARYATVNAAKKNGEWED